MVSIKSRFTLIILVLVCPMVLYWTTTEYSLSYTHLVQLHERWHNGDHEDCHGHVQLCWLRDVLSHGYNQTFPRDIYDLSTLYKFKTHMFLDYPHFFGARMKPYVDGPELRRRGEEILEIMKLEQMLTGSKLELVGLPHLRKCDYNPDKWYRYRFNAYHQKHSIHVHVDEILLTMNESRRMNDIFGVITTKRTVSACKLVNYFRNRTYHIVCPVLETKFQITIKATYHSISALTFQCKTSNLKQLKLYTNADFNHTQHVLMSGISLNRSAEVRCNDGKGHNKGFWLKGVPGVPQAVFHWATTTCHYSFIMSNTSLKCLRRKKVIMFGDSHMNDRQQSIGSTYKLTNFEYYVSTSHSIHLLRNLLLTYEAFLNGSKYADVLVVNVGAHDFVELDIITYIATMSDIFTMFKRFLDLPKPPKIIWLEIYPTPFNGHHGRYMTKLVVEGTNDWVNDNMRKLGIEVVHSFDIAITMESHDKDRIHYWDSFGPNMIPPGGKTSVGGAVISVLFNIICPNAHWGISLGLKSKAVMIGTYRGKTTGVSTPARTAQPMATPTSTIAISTHPQTVQLRATPTSMTTTPLGQVQIRVAPSPPITTTTGGRIPFTLSLSPHVVSPQSAPAHHAITAATNPQQGPVLSTRAAKRPIIQPSKLNLPKHKAEMIQLQQILRGVQHSKRKDKTSNTNTDPHIISSSLVSFDLSDPSGAKQ